MTVTNSTARGDYNCNGSTQAFSIPFQFFLNTEVQVIKTDTTVSPAVVTTLALTTDYTVSGGAGSTGTFTTVATFPTGIKLSVLPNLPFTQQAHYVPNDPFPAETHEQALDRLDMQDIQLNEKLGRAAVLPPTVTGVNPALPVPLANAALMWDAAGASLVNGTSGSTAFETLNPAMDGVATPGVRGTVTRGDHVHPTDTSRAPNAFTQAGAGAVASTVDAGLKSLYITTKNFGAVGDGVADDTIALQAAITAAITQKKTLLWNCGTYLISSPLIIGTFSAGAWAYTSCDIIGEQMAWDTNSATIANVQVTPNYKDKPAIIIQNGRSVTIENVVCIGTNNIRSVISASAPTNYYKMMTIGNFNQNASRDSQYSPYCGFCIDPFGTSVPSDGGFPGLSSYYVATASGSSYITLKNCIAENFIVGCAVTPNQTSQNADNITFDNCQFSYCKVGLSIGQSQSRNVVWRNGVSYFNYYCFDSRSYGNQTGDTPTILGGNLSGKYLFNIGSVSFMPSPIYGLYCESFSSIGFIGTNATGQQSTIFSGCSFNFSDWGGVGPHADMHLETYAPVEFDSCAFNTNDMTNPGALRFWHDPTAALQFRNCTYGTTLPEPSIAAMTGAFDTEWDNTHFVNCFQQSPGARGSNSGKDQLSNNMLGYDLGANSMGRSLVPMGALVKLTSLPGSSFQNQAWLGENKLSLGSLTVTIGTNGQASFTYATPAQLRVGDYIYATVNSTTFDGPSGPATFNPGFICIGQISNIVSTTITINGVPQSLTTGSYALYMEWMSRLHQASLGDTSNGTNTLLNVTNPTTWVTGNRIKGTNIPAGTWVTNVTGTTVTMSQNATGTATQKPIYDANLYAMVASDESGNTSIGGTGGIQTLNGMTGFTDGTYTAYTRFKTGVFQTGLIAAGPTGFLNGAGAVNNTLGSYVETLPSGAINFYKTNAGKVGGFDASGNFIPSFYTGATVGGSVASAAAITPTGPIFHVTGTATIDTINLPYTGFTGSLTIIPDGKFTFSTAGNIAKTSVAVVGQDITATYDGTKWNMSTLSGAFGSVAAAAPTGTTSTTQVMMGLGLTITPTRSGNVLISGSGQMANNTINDGANVQLYYGTGAAPVNGAAVTGTSVGTAQKHVSLIAADTGGWAFSMPVPGLTVGTAYWIDVALNAVTGGTATVTGVNASAVEL